MDVGLLDGLRLARREAVRGKQEELRQDDVEGIFGLEILGSGRFCLSSMDNIEVFTRKNGSMGCIFAVLRDATERSQGNWVRID